MDPFDFHWSVPEAGYEWVQVPVPNTEDPDTAKPQWVLTDGLVPGPLFRQKRYPPLRMFTGLFRTFAELPAQRETIRNFANKYGLLHTPIALRPTPPDNERPPLGRFSDTEEQWHEEIESLRRAVEIWDMARSGNADGLAHFFRWEQTDLGHHWIYDSHRQATANKESRRRAIPVRRFREMIEPVQDLITPDDVVTAARILVQRWINQQLEGNVSPRLLYHTDLDKQVLRFVPKNLLGAIWLQFAQAIDADKEYRACRVCGKWFEISLEGDGRTKRRLFCSEPCKSKDYRQRKDRARELHAQGRSAREIAQEVDTELASVKKWIRKPKA